VRGLPELAVIRDEGDAVFLGACTTHAAIEDGRVPDPTRGLLPAVARTIAYRAVRNRGTLGGSLAHADPAADWVNVMAVLDAEIVAAGPAGERWIRASAFVRGPLTTALAADEVITGVRLAKLSARARGTTSSTASPASSPRRSAGSSTIGARGCAALIGDRGRAALVTDAAVRRLRSRRGGRLSTPATRGRLRRQVHLVALGGRGAGASPA
jgi:CO/xanthine dehydrogenase FAD-binding subunit